MWSGVERSREEEEEEDEEGARTCAPFHIITPVPCPLKCSHAPVMPVMLRHSANVHESVQELETKL